MRNGLADPELGTALGRILFSSLQPLTLAARVARRPTFEGALLARHLVIDDLLGAAIDAGRVSQVVEIAAGLSGRGLRFARRYPGVEYVEADLPAMAEHKRRLLKRAGEVPENHRVAAIDAFKREGEGSLDELDQDLDAGRGVAVITEGLLNYFDRSAVLGLWARLGELLRGYPGGVYLSDLLIGEDQGGVLPRAALAGVSAFVRGWLHIHFSTESEVSAALSDAHFREVTLHRCDQHPAPRGHADRPSARVIRVIEARA